MKTLLVLSSLKDLGKVAELNEKFMRSKSAAARRKRDFRYAAQIDLQAAKWRAVARGISA